ncbi:hypothetical protein B0H10DRAFT_739493 [Mycena sp. CBHHK59/15]|nr:hypothetical protein B0H10DRAFT_739493 [Mycena sp. CBHHK59/15]
MSMDNDSGNPIQPPSFITIPSISTHFRHCGISTCRSYWSHIQSSIPTFIMSQGLGDTTQGISPVANLLRSDPALNHVKFIIPQVYDRICLHHPQFNHSQAAA